MNPFFSVIIPTFNREKTILRAVNSVLNQSFKNFELIVVDDGSTDNTLNILQNVDCIVLKQSNFGVSSARNLGSRNAKSNWLCFLDSDDEWLPNKLKVLHQYIKLNPGFRFFHSNEVWFRNGVRVNAMKKYDKSNRAIFERSLAFCIISPSTSCIHKNLYFEHNGFDESLKCCEDYDLWLKILLEEKVYFMEDFLINKYGGHDDQLSTSFLDIDYFKVRSLHNILSNQKIEDNKRPLMIETLLKKCEFLLKGYTKHNNLINYDEVKLIELSYIS